MTKRTVQMYAAITASGDALASITVPQNSKLKRVAWAVIGQSPVDGDAIQLELSVNSARQPTTNDATGLLSVAGALLELTTSGASNVSFNHSHEIDSPFKAGDRIYIHAVETGSATWQVRCLLFFE